MKEDYLSLLQKPLHVVVDRPLHSVHPEHKEMVYPLNYGYVKEVIAMDEEEQDVYVLGSSTPLIEAEATLVGVIHRYNDAEEKWLATVNNQTYTKAELWQAVQFTEQYFDAELTIWQIAEERVSLLLTMLKDGICAILQENLVGIYVHGSLAFDCFRFESSDLDFLLVTENIPSLKQKKELIQLFLKAELSAPAKGLECSLLLRDDCMHFTHPFPYYLHYSPLYKKQAQADPNAYASKMHGVDYDLAAHITVLRKAGMTLYGENIRELFQDVPWMCYLDSIRRDIRYEEETPSMHTVLNVCRTIAAEKEQLVLSKKEGALWALTHLSEKWHPLIRFALKDYLEGSSLLDTEQTKAFVSAYRERSCETAGL